MTGNSPENAVFEGRNHYESIQTPALPQEHRRFMKIARILDAEGGTFRLEYDNTRGHKQNTRLEAMTYDQAVREAKGYLEIDEDDRDPDGSEWDIE